MDWKRYYRSECLAAGARETLERWVRAADEASLTAAVERGAVLSFPHTALADAGPLQARVVHGLLDAGVERILALGVLHSGSLDVYRTALDEGEVLDRRAEAFHAVSGAFFAEESEARTPLGAVPFWRPSGVRETLRVDRHGLLDAEFSLDTFLTVCRAGADMLGRRPIPVLAAYVGMTRDPASGSFSVAEALGNWVRSEHTARAAVVATGDLAHYGTGYGEAWVPGGADRSSLTAVVRAEVERCLGAALEDGDWSGAYAWSRDRLRNDQREILPVLATTLGVPASHALLSFELSDYAPILHVAPPCFVASALVRYGG